MNNKPIIAIVVSFITIVSSGCQKESKGAGPEWEELYDEALSHFDANRKVEGEELIRKAYVIAEKNASHDHPDFARSLHGMGNVYANSGEPEKAEEAWLQALDIRRKALGNQHVDTGHTLHNLGRFRAERERLDEAMVDLNESLSIFENTNGKEHLEVGKVLVTRAVAYAMNDELFLCEFDIDRAKSIFESQPKPFEKGLRDVHRAQARLYFNTKEYGQAEAELLTALELTESIFGSNSQESKSPLKYLQEIYRRTNRTQDANRIGKQLALL